MVLFWISFAKLHADMCEFHIFDTSGCDINNITEFKIRLLTSLRTDRFGSTPCAAVGMTTPSTAWCSQRSRIRVNR